MEKTGKGRKTGKAFSPKRQEIEEFENPPELPPPPIHVAKAKPSTALALRSPLSVAFSHIRPNWRCYIQYVDLAARKGNTTMQRFLDVYNTLTKQDRASAWPEQVCDLANVTPDELVGAVCQNIWSSKAAESSMVSAIAHPELLMKTIEFARKEENFRDRELYYRMAGSLPDRKGTSINIYNQSAGQAGEAPSVVGKAKLRSFDDEVIDMDRDLAVADPPFLIAPNVSPEDH